MKNEEFTIADAELIPAKIETMDARLRHIEKIAGTVEAIAEKGFEAAAQYFKAKEDRERAEAQAENERHEREISFQSASQKRSVITLIIIISMVFSLVLVSLYLNQIDMAKTILTSSLAVAGGAGAANLFKGGK